MKEHVGSNGYHYSSRSHELAESLRLSGKPGVEIAEDGAVTLPSGYQGIITARPAGEGGWDITLTFADGTPVFQTVTGSAGYVIGRYFHHAEAQEIAA